MLSFTVSRGKNKALWTHLNSSGENEKEENSYLHSRLREIQFGRNSKCNREHILRNTWRLIWWGKIKKFKGYSLTSIRIVLQDNSIIFFSMKFQL